MQSTAGPIIAIEEAGAEGLPEFIELVETVGAWLFERGIPQWPPGSNRSQEPFFRALLARGTLLLARGPSGLLGGCIVASNRLPIWAAHPGEAGYLYKLVVARVAAGSGLSERIVEEAERWSAARGFPRLRLDCWEGSDMLRAYYRRLDFRELEATREHDYEVRLFEKDLSTRIDSHETPTEES